MPVPRTYVHAPRWAIGLDVSARKTGVAFVCERPGVIPLYFTLEPPKRNSRGQPLVGIQRAHWQIYKFQRRLDQWLSLRGVVSSVVIEGYPFLGKKLAVLVEVGALFRSAMLVRGFPVFECAPNTLKKFVLGKGAVPGSAASKAQKGKPLMAKAIHKQFKGLLPRTPNEDEVDALGLAWLGAAMTAGHQLAEGRVQAIETVHNRPIHRV